MIYRKPQNYDEYYAVMISRSEHYWRKRNFFLEALQAAEFQWFFVEGLIALEEDLHLPGLLSLMNGIEASIRWTHRQITRQDGDGPEPEKRSILSNYLLRQCHAKGMPVETLAFQGETDFLKTINDNKINADIVRTRHNICHGNIYEYVQEVGGEPVFVPGNLTVLSEQVLWVSFKWAHALGEYRRTIGMHHHVPTPNIPVENPFF
jgi:hypothetical protein